MSSLISSNSSAKSFEDIRKTAKEDQYQIENEEDFISMYNSDPFFKEKVNFKISEARKRISLNPSLASSASVLKNIKNITFKVNRTIEDKEFLEECLFYEKLISKWEWFFLLSFTDTRIFIKFEICSFIILKLKC